MGITDLFWAHAVEGQATVPGHPQVAIHPFPLYPVQAPSEGIFEPTARSILFSFLGTRSEACYVNRAREKIFEELEAHPDGFVRARGDWHYREIVYNEQIGFIKPPVADTGDQLAKEVEFRNVIARSVFSLCPGGSGPNTIRLWESLGLGAIPVVLSETWRPPGSRDLWEKAVVFCSDSNEDIRRLPELLRAIVENERLLSEKRHACRELWARYGANCFIYDIQCLYQKGAWQVAKGEKPEIPGMESLLALADKVPPSPQRNDPYALAFLGRCQTRLAAGMDLAGILENAPTLKNALSRCRSMPDSPRKMWLLSSVESESEGVRN